MSSRVDPHRLKALLGARDQLVKLKRSLGNQVRGLLRPFGIKRRRGLAGRNSMRRPILRRGMIQSCTRRSELSWNPWPRSKASRRGWTKRRRPGECPGFEIRSLMSAKDGAPIRRRDAQLNSAPRAEGRYKERVRSIAPRRMLQGAAREAVYWMRPSRPLRGARGRRDEIQNQDKSCLCYLRHGLMENRNGQVAAAEATLATDSFAAYASTAASKCAPSFYIRPSSTASFLATATRARFGPIVLTGLRPQFRRAKRFLTVEVRANVACPAKPLDVLDRRHIGQSRYSAYAGHAHQPPGDFVARGRLPEDQALEGNPRLDDRLRPGGGGSPGPSPEALLGRKLFIDAQAFNIVPSTEKCSALRSPFTSGRPRSETVARSRA